MISSKHATAATTGILLVLVFVGIAIVAGRPERQTKAEVAVTATSTASAKFIPPPSVAAMLHNAVLHWSSENYVNKTGGRDPYNGQGTTVDTWVQTNSTGAVVKLHAIIYDASGQAIQEVLQDINYTTRVFGQAYAQLFPTPPPLRAPTSSQSAGPVATITEDLLCQTGPGGLNLNQSADLVPPFADPAAPQAGYTLMRRSAPAPAAPLTPTPAGFTPKNVFETSSTVDVYSKTTPLSYGQKTDTVEIQPDGRIVQLEDAIVDGQGQTLSQSRQVYGPLQVYRVDDTPPSAFILSSFGQELCHE